MNEQKQLASTWEEVTNSATSGFKFEKPGDEVIGLLKSTYVTSLNNKCFLLDTPKGEVKVYGSAVLNTKMGHVVVGELVKIQFLGMVKGKGPQAYKDFKVWHRLATTEEVV